MKKLIIVLLKATLSIGFSFADVQIKFAIIMLFNMGGSTPIDNRIVLP
jgi:hypothetical protein